MGSRRGLSPDIFPQNIVQNIYFVTFSLEKMAPLSPIDIGNVLPDRGESGAPGADTTKDHPLPIGGGAAGGIPCGGGPFLLSGGGAAAPPGVPGEHRHSPGGERHGGADGGQHGGAAVCCQSLTSQIGQCAKIWNW